MNVPLPGQPLILIVLGDPELGRSVVSALAMLGFRTLEVPRRGTAFGRALEQKPDLIVVDASLPGVDGAALTARLRARTRTPIVVIARGEENGRGILGAGADDLLFRPFGLPALLARIRALLQPGTRVALPRPSPSPTPERLRIDRDRRALFVDGREIHLTPLEFKLLHVLAHNAGHFMAEEELLAAVWGQDGPTRQPYLRAHVRQLRQKLEKDPARPRHLLADVAGGYQLNLA